MTKEPRGLQPCTNHLRLKGRNKGLRFGGEVAPRVESVSIYLRVVLFLRSSNFGYLSVTVLRIVHGLKVWKGCSARDRSSFAYFVQRPIRSGSNAFMTGVYPTAGDLRVARVVLDASVTLNFRYILPPSPSSARLKTPFCPQGYSAPP